MELYVILIKIDQSLLTLIKKKLKIFQVAKKSFRWKYMWDP